MKHLRALLLAVTLVVIAITSSAYAAPNTVTLRNTTKPIAAGECAMLHQGALNSTDRNVRAWGRSKATNDCALQHIETTTTTQGVQAATYCTGTLEDVLRTKMTIWPYAVLASAYMDWDLCDISNGSINVSYAGQVMWESCWVNTLPAYGSGVSYCAGAPSGPSNPVGARMDYYLFVYATPWWHLNHGQEMAEFYNPIHSHYTYY